MATNRVKIQNTGHAGPVRVREVYIEKNGETGALTVRPIDHGHDQSLTPDQAFYVHVGETKGRAILIEEIE